jgi:hypothetical protein
MFASITIPKTVSVLVPPGATGYAWFADLPVTYSGSDSTYDWGNAFRGRGWDGTHFLTGLVNSNITLTIDYIPE